MRRFLFLFILTAVLSPSFLSPGAFGAESRARWILFGAPEESAESRLSSRGTLQPFPGSFEIVPWIEAGGHWLSIPPSGGEVSYKEDHLPIPSVIWNFPDFRLEVQAFAWGTPERSIVRARYRLLNKAARTVQGKIYFLLRPALKKSLKSIEFSEEGKSLRVNGTQTLWLSQKPEEAGFLKEGWKNLIRKIKRHEIPQIQSVKDPEGNASGVWSYPFQMKEGGKAVFRISIPLHPDGSGLEPDGAREALLNARAYWRGKLSRIHARIADAGLEDEVYLRAASLFILRDQPGFYPEERAPQEVWTAYTLKASETYLDYGFLDEAREDLEMASLRVDLSGEVQARMRKKETEDSVKAYGLQGSYVSAVWNYYRASGDQTWLSAKWPLVKKVLGYLKMLRAQRLTEWYDSPGQDRKRFYGILPPSMDPARGDFEPLHRYEDDLLAIKAFKDGQKIAEALNLSKETERMRAEEQALRHALLDSVEMTASSENVRFFPKAADKPVMASWTGALAVWPAEEAAYFPMARLDGHFQNAADLFKKAKTLDPEKAETFSDFQVIQALLRRGEKETAHEMFRFQRARLSGEDLSETAGFLQAFRDFFVYESSGKLILGAGLLPAWAETENGLQAAFPTPFGEIKYSVKAVKNGWHVHVEGAAHPPEGFVFCSPSGYARQIFHRLPSDFEVAS